MSYYSNQDRDFVKRTIEILNQYETLDLPAKEKFEVTLFLNCFVGLLIIPQQRLFKKLPHDEIDHQTWGISPEQIDVCVMLKRETPPCKSVFEVARHLRNSVSHYNFKVKNTDNIIDRVAFEDFGLSNRRDPVTDKRIKFLSFESVVTISDLRKFTEKLAETFLETMRTS